MPIFLANTPLSSTTPAAMNLGRLHHPPASTSSSSSSSIFGLPSHIPTDPASSSRSLAMAAPAGRRQPRGLVTIRASTHQAFFESSVVQAESDSIQAAYAALLKLGRTYGRFDREGKIRYLQEMKKLVERWQIFVKRMEMVDDFSAKVVVRRLRTEVGPLGLSNLDLADSMHDLLEEMRRDAEAEIA